MNDSQFDPGTIDELLIAQQKIAVSIAAMQSMYTKENEVLMDGLYVILSEAQGHVEKALAMLAPLDPFGQPLVAPQPAPLATAPDDTDDDIPILYEWPAGKPLPKRYRDGCWEMVDDDAPTPGEYDTGAEDPPGMVLKKRPAHERATKAKKTDPP